MLDYNSQGEIFLGHTSNGYSVVPGVVPGFKEQGSCFTLHTPERAYQVRIYIYRRSAERIHFYCLALCRVGWRKNWLDSKNRQSFEDPFASTGNKNTLVLWCDRLCLWVYYREVRTFFLNFRITAWPLHLTRNEEAIFLTGESMML